MTIDLANTARRLLGVWNDDETRELLRLARLGQQRERRKCGTCKHRAERGECRQYRFEGKSVDWFCADWEAKS